MVLVLDIVVTLLTILDAICIISPDINGIFIPWVDGSIDTFIGITLIFSIYLIRKTIKNLDYALPNDKLILVHFINFSLLTLLDVVANVYAHEAIDREEPTTKESELSLLKLLYGLDALITVTNAVNSFTCMFLIYLIWRFTREK